MGAADHAVLMVAEQRLDGLGPVRHLGRTGGRGRVPQLFGAFADLVQRLVTLVAVRLRRLLGGLADALVGVVDRDRLRCGTVRGSGGI
jgi:hypothetical protein